jgi:threonine/homoserine/homoserine lactone efflux protein
VTIRYSLIKVQRGFVAMEVSGFITYAVALAIAVAIPGPGVIALVARSLGSGYRPTLPMLFGMALGDVAYLTAAVLGLAYIASTFGLVFTIIRYLGAAYLLFIAWKFLRAKGEASQIQNEKAQGPLASFLGGLAITLGNPKVIVFYLALLPTFLDLTAVTHQDLSLLIGLTFVVLMMVLLPYVILAGRARTLLRTPRALRLLNRTAAGCLTGAAVVVAVKSA